MTRGTYVLFALALALATGCSEPRAGSLPPPTTPTPVSTASSAAPSPTASRDDASAELVSAARQFYELLDRAARDPHRYTDDVQRLMHPDCACRSMVDFLRDQARHGRRIERPVAVAKVTATPRGRRGGTVFLTLRQGAGRVIAADGRVVEDLKASVHAVAIDFARTGGHLLVTQIASHQK